VGKVSKHRKSLESTKRGKETLKGLTQRKKRGGEYREAKHGVLSKIRKAQKTEVGGKEKEGAGGQIPAFPLGIYAWDRYMSEKSHSDIGKCQKKD